MATQPQVPGMRRLLPLRNASLRNGIFTGVNLSCVFVAWLEVANRVPELERFAELRDLVAGSILILVLGIPVLRFRHRPGRLFSAGLTAWTILTVTYLVAEIHFTLLETRMGAFHVFVLGAVSYGFVAVLDWVFLICAGVRHQHVAHSRETAAGRLHTH